MAVEGSTIVPAHSGSIDGATSGVSSAVETLESSVRTGVHTTVAASDTIQTGLSKVKSVVVTLADDISTDPEAVTASIGDQNGAPAAGSFILKSWKTLGGTPAASTTFGKKVNWVAIGTP
jgi:hypothetical protein